MPNQMNQMCNNNEHVEENEPDILHLVGCSTEHGEYYSFNKKKPMNISLIDQTNPPTPTLDEFVQRGEDLNNQPNPTVREPDQAVTNDKRISRATNRGEKN